MVLALVIGDLHIPGRSSGLPQKFQNLLVPNKISHIFFTGNLCTQKQLDFFRSICSNVYIAQGLFDSPAVSAESFVRVQIGSYQVVLASGHQIIPWDDRGALVSAQREHGADVLIHGHTHKLSVWCDGEQHLFVNPGSATGAPNHITSEPPSPSFVLLDLMTLNIRAYLYVLRDDELNISKMDFDMSNRPAVLCSPVKDSAAEDHRLQGKYAAA